MYLVKPNKKTYRESIFHLDEETDILIRAYASYATVTEDDVVETLVKNVALDDDFINWLKEKHSEEQTAEALSIIEKILSEK